MVLLNEVFKTVLLQMIGGFSCVFGGLETFPMDSVLQLSTTITLLASDPAMINLVNLKICLAGSDKWIWGWICYPKMRWQLHVFLDLLNMKCVRLTPKRAVGRNAAPLARKRLLMEKKIGSRWPILRSS